MVWKHGTLHVKYTTIKKFENIWCTLDKEKQLLKKKINYPYPFL